MSFHGIWTLPKIQTIVFINEVPLAWSQYIYVIHGCFPTAMAGSSGYNRDHLQLTTPKIFTVWTFTEKVCCPLIQWRTSQTKGARVTAWGGSRSASLPCKQPGAQPCPLGNDWLGKWIHTSKTDTKFPNTDISNPKGNDDPSKLTFMGHLTQTRYHAKGWLVATFNHQNNPEP